MRGTSLYETDIVAWAEEQAQAVRRLARTRPDLSNALDWDNVAEELDCLGRSEVKGVTSTLRNVFVHILKGHCDPAALSMHRWSVETDNWLDDIRDDFTASMGAKLDLDAIWRKAMVRVGRELGGDNIPLSAVPGTCPFALDRLLAEDFTSDSACRALDRLARERDCQPEER